MLPIAPLVLAATTAYSGTDSIRVANCSIQPLYEQQFFGDVPQEQILGNQLKISFINNAAATASSVTFDVSDDSGALSEIVERGTFSPGVTIVKMHDASFGTSGSVTCNVKAVTFSE
jgi:hypothetical protein